MHLGVVTSFFIYTRTIITHLVQIKEEKKHTAENLLSITINKYKQSIEPKINYRCLIEVQLFVQNNEL